MKIADVMQNLLRKMMIKTCSIFTILLFYSFSAFAGVPFTLCNGDAALDKKYYDDWKRICNKNPEKDYLACIRENASDTCDMPYQDMRAEIIGGKFILKRRNVKEIDKWDVIKHKPSFALKLIAKPEPETDWGDYVFRDIININDGDIIIKGNVVVKCKIKRAVGCAK